MRNYMETKYLLPNSFKLAGWIIFIIGIAFGVLFFIFPDEVFHIKVWMPALHYDFPMDKNSGFLTMVHTAIIDEITGTLIILGALLVAFSKEKEEDEYIMKIRVESLVWAVIVNSLLLLFCVFAFYGLSFMLAMIFNVVTVLILFVIKFQIALRKANKYAE